MLSVFLIDKCKALLKENKDLLVASLSDPQKWVKLDMTGQLVTAAEGGIKGLSSFAGDYIAKNADVLIVEAFEATGLESTYSEAYNLIANMMTAAIMARNDLVLRMMKEVAWGCMREIAAKDEILIELAEIMKQLHVTLASLVGTSQKWDDYYATLRQALKLVAGARSDLTLVRSTFQRNNFWLARKFDGTITKLETARDLITPKTNNPAVQSITEGSYKIKSALKTGQPDKTQKKENFIRQTAAKTALIGQGLYKMEKGLAYFGEGLSEDFPLPTTEQKWQAALAIGKLTNQALIAFQGYTEATIRVNGLVLAFIGGLDAISLEVPQFYKKFILSLMDKAISRTDNLVGNMALTLNGSESAISGPIKGFRPNSLSTTVLGFNWVMDINLILQSYKTIPTTQLSKLNLNQEAAAFYQTSVAKLKKLDSTRSGLATITMTDGQEDVGNLETQLLAFLLEANNAITSATVRKNILQLSRTILSRLELSLVRDHQIYDIMAAFWVKELPQQEILDQIYNGLVKLMGDAGLDRMKDQLMGGDFKKLFNLKGRDASYVGAALVAVSELKKCFKTGPERDKIANVEADLISDSDLLNITFSIKFDLAILKNLSACFDFNALAEYFKKKQDLCGILNDFLKDSPKMSALFTKMNSMFSSWGGF